MSQVAHLFLLLVNNEKKLILRANKTSRANSNYFGFDFLPRFSLVALVLNSEQANNF